MAERKLGLTIVGKDAGGLALLGKVGKEADKAGKTTESSGLTMGKALAGAATAATAFAVASSKAFSDAGVEVLKLQRVVGGTPEEMSRLRFAVKQSGVDFDGFTKAIGVASKKLASSKDTLAQFGIEANGTDGKLRPMSALLPEIADKFARMSNTSEKAALAQQLFGKAGMDMLPFLNRGSAGIAELMAKTDEYGQVLSGEQLQAIKDNKVAQRELGAAFEGLQIQVGTAVLPIMTQFTQVVKGSLGPVAGMVAPLAAVGGSLLGVSYVASKTVEGAKKLASGFKSAAEGAGSFARGLTTAGGAMKAASFAGAAAGVYLLTQRMADNKKVANEWVDGLNLSGTIPEKLKKVQDALKGAREESEKFVSQDVGPFHLYGSNEGRAAADRVSALEEEEKKLNKQVKANTEQTKLAASGMDEYGNQIDGTTEAVKSQNDTLRAATGPLFEMTNAMSGNTEAQREARVAASEAAAAQKEYDHQVLIFGANSAPAKAALVVLEEATRKKTGADNSAVKSAMDLTYASNTLAAGIADGSITMNKARKVIDDLAASGSITAQQADGMRLQFLGAAGGVDHFKSKDGTGISVWADTTQATEALERLAGLLGSTALSLGSSIGVRLVGGVGGFPGFARGGRPRPGEPTIVGEEGPELVTFGRGAYVHNARQTAAWNAPGTVYEDGSVRGSGPVGGAGFAGAQRFAAAYLSGRGATGPRYAPPSTAKAGGTAGAINVVINVAGSVQSERDLTKAVIDGIRQAQRTSSFPILAGTA